MTIVMCDDIQNFKLANVNDLGTKKYNYDHNNGDCGDGFQTSQEIINKHKNNLGKLIS